MRECSRSYMTEEQTIRRWKDSQKQSDMNFRQSLISLISPICLISKSYKGSTCPPTFPILLPVLTPGAATYPPGLAALRRVRAVLRGLRLARSPLRYRLASPPLLSEPRFPSARTLRGSALPVYPSPPLCAVAAPSPSYRMGCRPLCRRYPLSSRRMGWRPASRSLLRRMGCRPRSRGACGQMVSPVRSGTPPTAARQRGGGARRVDRGRGEAPRSAELRSLRDQPSAPARATHRHIALPPSLIAHSCLMPPPSPPCAPALPPSPTCAAHACYLPPPSLLPPNGLSFSEPRSVRVDVIPGSERSATGVTRRPGE